MKAQIHPKYHEAEVTCACGNHFTLGSPLDQIKVEVCYNCHPFYTGQMKFLDTAGRVDAFRARLAGKTQSGLSKSERRKVKRAEKAKQEQERPETLEDLRKAVKAKK